MAQLRLLTDVVDAGMACNIGTHSPVSSKIVDIPAGAELGALWQRILGELKEQVIQTIQSPRRVMRAKVVTSVRLIIKRIPRDASKSTSPKYQTPPLRVS
jgi:hypothetical protein